MITWPTDFFTAFKEKDALSGEMTLPCSCCLPFQCEGRGGGVVVGEGGRLGHSLKRHRLIPLRVEPLSSRALLN